MKELFWRAVKHSELSIADGLRIAKLKNQYWSYGLDSQIRWMKENIDDCDYHLLFEEIVESDIILLAYLTLVKVTVAFDENVIDAVGIGSVCVDKSVEHRGYGRLLLDKANKYILAKNKLGILLCKDSLVGFYEKNGWKKLLYNHAAVAENNYVHNIMVLSSTMLGTYSRVYINKNF